jgi:hypothetical protein
MAIVIVQGPDPVIELKLADEQLPFVTVMKPGVPALVLWGGVHPAGMVSDVADPLPNEPRIGDVNVNVKESLALPAATLVGLTVIVPDPSEPFAPSASGPSVAPLPAVETVCSAKATLGSPIRRNPVTGPSKATRAISRINREPRGERPRISSVPARIE